MDKDKDKLYKLTIYHNNGHTSYIKMTMQHVDEFMCLLCDSQYDFTYAIGYTKKDILSFRKSDIRTVQASEIGGVDERR